MSKNRIAGLPAAGGLPAMTKEGEEWSPNSMHRICGGVSDP
jgi:hypothetical protein